MLPAGWIVTGIRIKRFYMKMASKGKKSLTTAGQSMTAAGGRGQEEVSIMEIEDSISEDDRGESPHKPASENVRPIQLTVG